MSRSATWRKSEPEQEVRKYFDFFTTIFNRARIRPFAVKFWDDSEWRHGDDAPHFTLELKHPGALRRMFWRPSELSLGEAFIYGDFDVHGDMEASFALAEYLFNRDWRLTEKLRLARKLLRLPRKSDMESACGAVQLRGRSHSKDRDAQAIAYHYDISNDFYQLWLDQRMIYSCAFFHRPEDTLDVAQERKLDYLCRKLRLQRGEKLLDIGCGWGGLILHAVKNYGVTALGITLSRNQADFANEQIRKAGLAGDCRAEICDYRDMPANNRFDKVVSVGMFEHVGEKKLPEYFTRVYQLLNSGGVFLNHGITRSVEDTKNRGPSFIDTYVFPDGELLPISTSLRIAEESGFEIRDVESHREHYAMTLRQWVKRLEEQQDKACELSNSCVYRIWRAYMAGSAYGFETGRIGLHQTLMVKSRKQASGLPLTRCDWYRPCPSGYH